jgi:hypothetical protein
VVGQLIGPVGGGDIDLDSYQIWVVIQAWRLDMLVLDGDLVVGKREYLIGRQ